MKKLIFAIAMLIFSINGFAQTSTYVNGYTRSNGTYVSGYYRTTPDYTKNNNYSTIGNVNPYTGSNGTKVGGLNPSYNSYSVPSYNSRTYYTPSYPRSSPKTTYTIYSYRYY